MYQIDIHPIYHALSAFLLLSGHTHLSLQAFIIIAPIWNTSIPIGNNTPRLKSIVQIAHIPTIGNAPQQTILPTGAVRRAEHAKIIPVRLRGALPRDTFDICRVEFGKIQYLAVTPFRTRVVENGVFDVVH